jgi:hypothetical protein
MMRRDLAEEGLSIPDRRKDRFYSAQELEGARTIRHRPDGEVVVRLKNGEIAHLYSIDLE